MKNLLSVLKPRRVLIFSLLFFLLPMVSLQGHPVGVALTLVIQGEPDPVLVGDALLWHISLSNEDPVAMPALGVVLQDVLPAGVALVSFDISQGQCVVHLGAWLSCEVGDLMPGQTVTAKVRVRVNVGFVERTLVNSIAITSFGPAARHADAVVASAKTVVLQRLPEPPPEPEPQPEPQPEPVVPRTIAVSPSCVEAGGQLTLMGQGFDIVGLGGSQVRIGGQPAEVLAASATGLVVAVPALAEGPAAVTVEGVANAPLVRVSPACNPELFTEEDTEIGYVTGDVLVFFNEPLTPEALEAFRVEYGFKTLIRHPLLGYYFAQLEDEAGAASPEANAPVACRINKRDSAPPLDVLLLVDRSGTMSPAAFKPLFTELLDQMYCLLNRNSRVALMTYNDRATLEVQFAPWQQQSDALLAWSKRPLETRKHSDLGLALKQGIDYLKANARPGVGQQILTLTRGPATPRIVDFQAIVQRANEADVRIHGLGLTSRFFPAADYDALRAISQATGRNVQILDERDLARAPAVVTCAIVYGVYGGECDANDGTPVLSTPVSDAVTCVVARGIYGVSECGKAGLAQIPSIEVDRTAKVIERLNHDPRVEEAFFNDLLDNLQNDPALSQQAWLLNLGLPAGFETFFPHRAAGVKLAVIDTGVDLGLTQDEGSELVLDAVAPEGLNLAPLPPGFSDLTGNDDLGHGTAVTSIAASVIDNAFNGGGVAPKATIIALKVFAVVNGKVKASNDSVAQAMMNAFVLGVDVINMSLGCHGCTKKQEKRLRKFYRKILNSLIKKQNKTNARLPIIVAASGNDGENFIDAPAFHDAVIAVGSVQPDLQTRSDFSNYGPELDFLGYGEGPLTTLVGGDFNNPGVGTSFSSPQVSGLVALILGENPGLDRQAVVEQIKRCFSVDLGAPGFDEQTGWGRIRIPENTTDPACLPGA